MGASLNFFDVVSEVCRHESVGFELFSQSGKRLDFQSSQSMAFPACDIESVCEDDDFVRFVCSFMGLYGVDSPLPSYLNNYCLGNQEGSIAFRAFLDVLNQRIYVLYFLSWRAFNPEACLYSKENTYGTWLKCFTGLPIQILPYALGMPLESYNQSCLIALLERCFPYQTVEVETGVPTWEMVQTESQGLLGENTLLGERAYGTHGAVVITFGPMSLKKAALFYEDNAYRAILLKILDVCLPIGHLVELHLNVEKSHEFLSLGMPQLILGRYAWLGECRQDTGFISVITLPMGNG